MKRFALALAIFMVAPLALLAQQEAPEIPFDSVPNLLKLPVDPHLIQVQSRGQPGHRSEHLWSILKPLRLQRGLGY